MGEHRGKLGADGGGRRDDHDRDESGNQAIFDGGDAGLVFEKTGDKIFMAEAPFVKKQLLGSKLINFCALRIRPDSFWEGDRDHAQEFVLAERRAVGSN